MRFFDLPDTILLLIFEFDSSFHDIYKTIRGLLPKYIVYRVVVKEWLSLRYIIDLDDRMIITNCLQSPTFKSTIYFYSEKERLEYINLFICMKRETKIPFILFFQDRYMNFKEFVNM